MKGYYRKTLGREFCDEIVRAAVRWYDRHKDQYFDEDACRFATAFTADLIRYQPELKSWRSDISGYVVARFSGPLRVPLGARIEATRILTGLSLNLGYESRNTPPSLTCSRQPASSSMITGYLHQDPPMEVVLRGWSVFRLLEFKTSEIRCKNEPPQYVQSVSMFGKTVFSRLLDCNFF